MIYRASIDLENRFFRKTQKLSERRAKIQVESIQTYISYRIDTRSTGIGLDEKTKTLPHQFIFFTCDFNLSPLHTHTRTRPSYTRGKERTKRCQENLVYVCFSETRVYFLRSLQYDIRIKNYSEIRTGHWRVQKRPDRLSL